MSPRTLIPFTRRLRRLEAMYSRAAPTLYTITIPGLDDDREAAYLADPTCTCYAMTGPGDYDRPEDDDPGSAA